MKKSSIFILLVTFIVSIFMISFYGGSIRNDQFKRYFDDAEILYFEQMKEDGTLQKIDIREESIGKKTLRYSVIELNQYDGIAQVYIKYSVTPEDVTDSDGYEFVITSGNGTFDVVEHGETITYNYVDINKNEMTFRHECSIRLCLRTTDGSGIARYVTIICSAPATE